MRTLLLLGLCAMTVSYAAAQAPSLADPPQFIYIGDGAITVGLDVADGDSANVGVTAVSDNSQVELLVPAGNRFANFNFEEDDGTPIGTVLVELFETRGGDSTARIIDLATRKFDAEGNEIAGDPFYTDVLVHRVANLPGFIIQTGDAVNGNGTGGSTLGPFADQFELQDGLSFDGDNVVAMANSGVDTNNSQFFFTAGPTPHLTGKHMIFGHVVSGRSVLDFIIDQPTPAPVLASVEVLDNTQDATLTAKPAADFVGKARVTVTMDDGDGNVVDHEIAVHRLITPLREQPLSSDGAYAQEHYENRLYVADGAGGLKVFDVTDPANALFLGSVDTPGTAVSVAVAEYPAQTVVFVGDTSGGISVFDVNDPANITLLQLLAVDANDDTSIDAAVWDVEIDDNKILYVAETTGGFTTFDAADPANNILLDSLDLIVGGVPNPPVTNVELDGDRAYLALQNYGLVTVNIADPADLSNFTSAIALAQPFGMAHDGDTLYVAQLGNAAGASGVSVFDVSNPDSPVLGRKFLLDNLPWLVGAGRGIGIVGHQSGGFTFIDGANPLSPVIDYTLFTATPGNEATIVDDVIYLPVYGGGVLVMDGDPLFDADVAVTLDTQHVADGGAVDIGQTTENGPALQPSFTVRNDGNGNLTIQNLAATGGVTVASQPAELLEPDGVTTFALNVPAGAAGVRTETVSFLTNDRDENFFEFDIQATVVGNATINGTVWDDLDADGNDTATEPGIADVTVRLYRDDGDNSFEPQDDDALSATVTTDTAGGFQFTAVPAGTFWVEVEQDAGPLQYRQVTGGTNPTSQAVAAGSDITNADFGMHLPVVTLTATDDSASESGDPATFQVARTGPAAGDLTVNYATSGSAGSGDDYNLPGNVIIPDTADAANVDLIPVDDDKVEPAENVTLSLLADPAYVLGDPTADSATVNDNDTTDLAASALFFNPGEYPAGDAIDLSFDINNSGNDLAANLPFTAQVRFSGNTTWGDADDIVLLPDLPIDGDIGSGAASIIGRRVYVPLEAAAATDLFVGVKVDIDNVVAETDEANNVLWSATANVSTIAEPAPASAWRFEFSLANAENEAIQIGMQSSATDGFDLDVDTLTFVPGNPEGFAYFQVSDKSVTHDIRSISNVAPWDLAVIAGAQPVTLSWDPAAIPADQQLVVSAVDDQDEVVLDQITYLTSQSSLQVAAGTAVDFRIDLVPLADDNFVVSAGWNLLSAPLEPVTPDVASVLADAGRTAHLLGGRLWRWSGAQLAASEAMHGATGYWFYALHNETVNIRGVIPFTGRIPLQPGWNLIGVSEQMAVPVIANASAFWRWADNRFHNATVLQPGRGYWVYVEEETVMDVVAP
ncbi:MAG: peptidylprolyl isomerase [Lentisphaeria bacterium]|jgi:cyclophilin family peptidyl-prolyl cis-trans isomerase|nr:peptidylprolyl isomerase [Lentisphaeria bacterium]